MSALNDRMYQRYASTHAGRGSIAVSRPIYLRDIKPFIPPRSDARVVDIGCGQGELVELMQRDGIDAWGMDISPEQVELATAAGVKNIELGDFHVALGTEGPRWDAVIATDVLEHLSKDEVLSTLDETRDALRPGGVFIGRVPNAVSPTGGHIMYGDITHRTWFTGRSVSQLAATCGFAAVAIHPCPPLATTAKGLLRHAVWSSFSALIKLALAAETGAVRGHIVTHNLVFVLYRDRPSSNRRHKRIVGLHQPRND